MSNISKKSLCIINLIVFVVSLIVVYIIADFRAISIISRANMTLLTPVNFTFRIWMLIYSASLALNIYFLFHPPLVKVIAVQIALSVLNSLWIILWTNNFLVLSWIVNILMFISLSYIVFSYNLSRYHNHWISKYFYLYFGWICVAVFLQMIVVVKFFDFHVAEIYLSIVGLGIISGGVLYFIKYTLVYPLVIIWAFLGIYFQNENGSTYNFQCLVLLLACLFISLVSYRSYLKIKQVTD